MTVEKRHFGYTAQGAEVNCYTLADGGMSVEILSLGGIIRSINIPVSDGVRDIALGFDDVAGYEGQSAFIGALIGRVANRIGRAAFSLNGRKYTLEDNDAGNCLHGGSDGFDKRIWEVSEKPGALWLTLESPDMDGGFPGNLKVDVRYTLKDRALTIEYKAVSDADTPVNLTNHCYFNLAGHGSGGIEDHNIRIFSDCISEINDLLIPTGKSLGVEGTPFDFRESRIIGEGINSDHPQIALGGGYDHNFVLSQLTRRALSPAAVLEYDGVAMTCLTTKPCIQFYSGNFLTGETGKGGAAYLKRNGLCLETQYWPDVVNRIDFPDCTLRKGEIYHHITVYKFDICHKM